MRELLFLALLPLGNLPVIAQDAAPTPAYNFLISRDEKIKLAESAAPAEISGKATVYLLEHGGYIKVRDGSNGFACIVDRQTPFNSEPTCFDAEGVATTLLTRFFVEEQRAKGKSEEAIKAELDAGYKSGRFKAPGKPGIVYMLSDSIYLFINGKVIHTVPHLMFYAPYATEKDIGSPAAGNRSVPHIIREGQPDAYIVVLPAGADHATH